MCVNYYVNPKILSICEFHLLFHFYVFFVFTKACITTNCNAYGWYSSQSCQVTLKITPEWGTRKAGCMRSRKSLRRNHIMEMKELYTVLRACGYIENDRGKKFVCLIELEKKNKILQKNKFSASLSHPCHTNNGNCEHLCIPRAFSQHKCMCATGYTLDGATSCKLFDRSFLLVATKTRITGIP